MLLVVPIAVVVLMVVGLELQRRGPDARAVLSQYEGEFVRLGVSDGGRIIAAFSGRLRGLGDDVVVLEDWELEKTPAALKWLRGRASEPYCPRISDVRWVEAQGTRTRL